MRDYDLLTGLLAYQLRLASAGTLAWYAQSLESSPDTSLVDFLIEKRAIHAEDAKILDALAGHVVQAHGGDAGAALQAFGGPEAAEEAFARAVLPTEQGRVAPDAETGDDRTIAAEQLPHGLPRQITPETAGRYTGGSEYARGGIGRILLVHDEQIGRDVILKELLPHRATSPTDTTLSRVPPADSPGTPLRQSAAMIARFLQEAKITGQLEHPSIVPVYELGLRADGQLYYTMKLVRGNTLTEAIEACKTHDDRLALIRPFLDVCQAMAYAHAKGVIHRDLKPSNIMVGEFGECVVLDWGLAKMREGKDAHAEDMEKTMSRLRISPGELDAARTGSKDIMGTPLYMAPEQARGEVETVTYHSDVYSLGVILYEMLTGHTPHRWTNTYDTVRRVATLPVPPISKAAPQTPPELAAICDKALAFDERDRYPSAKELAADLQRFLEGALVDAYAYSVTDQLGRLYRQHRAVINASVSAAVLIIALGVASYVSIYQSREHARRAQAIAEEQRTVAEQERAAAQEQRSRAESAEEQTAREKYFSEIRLADAYVREFKFQAAEDALLATDPRFRNIEWGYLMAQCHQDIATLGGHGDLVFKTFYAPDGSSIVTVSGDSSARLWDAETYTQIHEWRYPGLRLRHAEFSPTGDRLAIALTDGSVRMVDPVTGEERYTLEGHEAPVNYCTFSQDGAALVTGSSDRFVHVWDLESRSIAATLPEHPEEIKAAAFTGGDTTIYTQTADGMLRLYPAAGGEEIGRGPGIGVRRYDDGAYMFARHENSAVLYSGVTMEPLLTLAHETAVSSQVADLDNGWLLTGSEDGNLRLWRYPEGTLERVFNLMEPIRACAIAGDSGLVAAIATNGLGMTWELASGNRRGQFAGHRGAAALLNFSPDGEKLLTCGMDGTARVWQTVESSLRRTIVRASGSEETLTVAAATALDTAALGTMDGTITVYDPATGAEQYRINTGERLWNSYIALFPSGDRLALVADSFLPLILDLSTGAVVSTFRGHDGYVASLVVNHDGTELITSSWDKTARVWSAETGSERLVFKDHDAALTYACFSPQSDYVATASSDRRANVYGRADSQPRFTVTHERSVVHCAFSPDSSLFATASDDGTAQIWDVKKRAQVAILEGQMYGVRQVAFIEGGGRIVTASDDGTVRVWDTRTGTQLCSMDGFPGLLTHAGPGSEPGSLVIATRAGDLSMVETVSPQAGEAPPATASELRPLAARYQQRARSHAARGATGAGPPESYVLVPAELLAAYRSYLLESPLETDSGYRAVDEILARELWRLELRAGDRVVSIDAPPPSTNAAALPVAAMVLEIERDNNSHRLRVVPVSGESRSVEKSLERDQALALLREARKILRANTEAILQVSRTWGHEHGVTLEKPDSIPGLVINSPGPGLGQAMLESAGLQPMERLIAINGESITTLDQLLERCEAGISYLEANDAYQLPLELDRGAYDIRTLTYVNAH